MMNTEELLAHHEYIDGVQKAQSLVLRALLKQQPAVVNQLRNYMAYMETQDFYAELSTEQARAMKMTLAGLISPAQGEGA